MGIREFFRKNMVIIVIVPGIIATHYGWLYLQENDALVKPQERKGLPHFDIMHLAIDNIKGSTEDKSSTTPSAK